MLIREHAAVVKAMLQGRHVVESILLFFFKTIVMANVFFIIVLLHLLAGFGWVLYKIGFQNKPKD